MITSSKVRSMRRLRLYVAASFVAFLVLKHPVYAQDWSNAPMLAEPVAVAIDEARVISIAGGAKKVFVANPDIADVDASNSGRLVVYGRKRGATSVIITSRYGQETQYRIVVRRPLEQLAENISRLYPDSDLTLYDAPLGLTITGTIANAGDALQVRNLAAQYLDKEETLNFNASIVGGSQVNLHVRIIEVSRVVSRTLGFNLGGLITSGSIQIGGLTGRSPVNLTAGQTSSETTVDSVFARSGSALSSIATRYVSGGTSLSGMIDALEQQSFLKVLAEPNLTAISGETANFLAGGELPVPIASGSGDNQQVSIQYKPYGIGLKFTPVILDRDNISIKVLSEVSEVSQLDGVKVGGVAVPGLTTRRVETAVQLRSGQSFAIAGLYNDKLTRSSEQFPFLGNIPVIGELFRSRSFRKNNTELIIIITPEIAEPVDTISEIMLPTGALEKPPTQNDALSEVSASVPEQSDTKTDDEP